MLQKLSKLGKICKSCCKKCTATFFYAQQCITLSVHQPAPSLLYQTSQLTHRRPVNQLPWHIRWRQLYGPLSLKYLQKYSHLSICAIYLCICVNSSTIFGIFAICCTNYRNKYKLRGRNQDNVVKKWSHKYTVLAQQMGWIANTTQNNEKEGRKEGKGRKERGRKRRKGRREGEREGRKEGKEERKKERKKERKENICIIWQLIDRQCAEMYGVSGVKHRWHAGRVINIWTNPVFICINGVSKRSAAQHEMLALNNYAKNVHSTRSRDS